MNSSMPDDLDLLHAQEKISQLTETIQTINELAIKLSNLLTAKDPVKYIATIIREIPGVFSVSVSSYQSDTKELIVEHLALPPGESGLLPRINTIIGRSLIGMHIPVSQEMYEQICAEAITTVGDMHDVTFGEIPKSVATALKHTFGLDKFYGLALVDNEGLMGTIVIAMRKKAEPLTESLRLMLGRVCVVILRRTFYEKSLIASEAKFRSYVEYAPMGILVVNRDGRFREVNPAAARLLGYEEAELLTMSIPDVMDADYLLPGLAHFKKVVETGRATGEYKLRRKDNVAVWAIIEAVSLNHNRFMAFLLDVTARREAEKSSKIKDDLLHLTGEMAQVGGWEFETETMAGTWTDEVAHIHDVDPSEETNVTLGLSFYSGEARQKIEEAIQNAIEHAVPYDLELPLTSAKGRHKWIRTMGLPIVHEGKVVKVRGIFQDITERRKAEEALRKQVLLQHQLTQLAATVPGMIYSYKLAPDGIVSMPYISGALEDVLGIPADGLAQDASVIFDIIYSEDIDRVITSIAESAQNMIPWRCEFRIQHPAKGERWIEGHSVPQQQADDTILWHGFLQDVTDRKEAEEAHKKLEAQLRQSQKIESIGRLAGGVAHDFNNLLTVIQMYGDLMYAHMDKSDPLLPKLEQIRQASQRASDLTSQLLAFSRKQILSPTTLNLNELITNLQKMLGRLIGEDILLSIVLQPNLWTIKADSGQIQQVIMNLVVNARDAMPEGGQLTIETQNIYQEEGLFTTKVETLTGPCVLLSITDTGEGMDAATRQQIFEPFFTTKEAGSGTGLGLAMVHGIIRQSGGNIYVYSEPGQGTAFKIYLPASNKTEEYSTIKQPEEMSHVGQETILVVEDEEAVRELVCATLEKLGYSVLAAQDGFTALALVEQQTGSIDLLLTDVIMPHMSGRELAEQLTHTNSKLKVLYMSGYTDDAVVRHGILTAQVDFLPKPFSHTTLAKKVRSVLQK